MPKYGIYRPKFYGYNPYGLLIDTDVQGVKVSCPASVGEMTDSLTFYASGKGDALLTATLGNLSATVPVQVLGEGEHIHIVNDSIITDTYKEYVVDVENTFDGVTCKVNPAALSWSSSDESVAMIDAATGVLKGVNDGVAYVVGTLGEMADTLKVIVERPTAHVMPMDPNLDISTWKITQTGGKNAVATAHDAGFTYTYTGASGRSPKIVLTKSLRLWSLPDAIRIRFNPGEAPINNVVLGLRSNGQGITYQTLTPDTLIADKPVVLELPTAAWMEATDMSNYPIVLSTIQLNMNPSATGKKYTIDFEGFETVYNAIPEERKGDINGDGVVNVSDVTSLINHILGTELRPVSRCDLNADAEVNVSDVTTLINLILNL